MIKTNKQVAAFEVLRDLFTELSDDFHCALELSLDSPSNFSKRACVRSFFAMIEGTIYQLKQIALQCHDESPLFESFEIELLRERTSSLSDNGKPKERDIKLKFLPNLLFTLASLIKAYRIDYKITKDAGWEALVKALALRHRITHPKSKHGLLISTDELAILSDANKWFGSVLTELITTISKKLNG